MANRVTGLSGMDIEGMVSNLMKVETAKVDKLYKQKTLLTWKQEAYKNMVSTLNNFQNKFFKSTTLSQNMKYDAFYGLKNFSIKTGSGAESTAVTVKNNALSKNVEHKLKILSLAQAQKMSGSPAGQTGYSKKIVSEEIDVDSLKDGMSVSLNLDGKVVTATLAEGFVDTLSGTREEKLTQVAAELNRQFEAFGKGTDASVTNKVKVEANGNKLTFGTEVGRTLQVSSFSNGYTASASFSYKKDDVKDTLEFELGGQTISVSTLDDKGDKIDGTELAKRINSKINDSGLNGEKKADGSYAQNFVVSASGNTLKFEAKSQDTKFTLKGGAESVGLIAADYNKELYGKTASEFGVASGASTDNTSSMTVSSMFGAVDLDKFKINGKSLSSLKNEDGTQMITADTTISEFMTIINDSKNGFGVNLSYNAINGSFTMESSQMGEDNAFVLSKEASDKFGFVDVYQRDANGDAVKDANGKYLFNEEAKQSAIANGKFVLGQDAEFIVDGVRTTRESNDVLIGDLSVTLNKADANEEITIKSSSDTDTILKNIKDFVNSYNELLSSFTTSYNETRAKSSGYGYYEPLTDEERSALSEKDVEQWDAKAKQGILYRDSATGKVIDQLRNSMSQSVKLKDGREISLYDIGISSTDWKDMGKLSIDEDKLRKALEERPEDVAALFSQQSDEGYYGNRAKRQETAGIAYRLDDVIQDATRTNVHPTNKTYGYFTELVGSQTTRLFDNVMYKKLQEINQKISDLEDLNLSKENRYYDMFSKMEQAMTKAQNQMSQAGLG